MQQSLNNTIHSTLIFPDTQYFVPACVTSLSDYILYICSRGRAVCVSVPTSHSDLFNHDPISKICYIPLLSLACLKVVFSS